MAFELGKAGVVGLAAILLVAALAVLMITVDVDADEVDEIDEVPTIGNSEDLVRWLEDDTESSRTIDGGVSLNGDVIMNGHKTIVSGTIKIGSGYRLEISKSSSLTLSAGATIENEGSFENVGSVITERIVDSEVDSEVWSIDNRNYFYNDGTVTNYGTITNGPLEGSADDSRIVNYNTIINYGLFRNNGLFTNHDTFTNSSIGGSEVCTGSVRNCGQIINNAQLINANGADYFMNENDGTITNNNVMSGIIDGNDVDDLSNGDICSFESIDYDSDSAVYAATVANPAAVQITGIPSSFGPIAVVIGPMCMSIPSGTIVAGTPILVAMYESESLFDNLSRTFEVSVTGLESGAEVEVTVPLPSTGMLDGVYHTVDDLFKSKMEVVRSTGSDVTFKTDHNSTYTVVTVKDDSGSRTYDVSFASGAGYFLDTRAGTTGTGSEYVFTVRAMDGYEVTSVTASNGTLIRNGFEYTLSNVTADTTIRVITAEKIPEDTEDTSSYMVIGAAVGVIIILGLAALMVTGKKP